MLTRLSAENRVFQIYSFHTFPSYNDYISRIGYKLSLSFPLFIGIRYQTVHYFVLILCSSIFVRSTNFLLSFFIRYSFFSLPQIVFRYQYFFILGSFNSTSFKAILNSSFNLTRSTIGFPLANYNFLSTSLFHLFL